jgi:hypothetical protein
VRATEIPMRRGVAARPRDERGYPVLAITPWPDGQPHFAATGTARTYTCVGTKTNPVTRLSDKPGVATFLPAAEPPDHRPV